jgi:hypothetical protein
MGKMVHMPLTLKVAGASVDEIARGLSAAQAIFAAYGTTYHDAALARFQRDGFDFYVKEDGTVSDDWMTPEQHRICNVWDEAEEAAVVACCHGWPKRPDPGSTSAYLQIPMTPCEAAQHDLVREACRQ